MRVRGYVIALVAVGSVLAVAAPIQASGPSALPRPTATIPIDPNEVGGATSIPYSQTVPAFPTSVRDYKLKSQKRSGVRLFQGSPWEALPPMDQGLAGHCGIALWIVRWRSQNPDVQVFGGIGDTAMPGGFNRIGKAPRGGAGYITGYACVSPGLRFARAINGNGSNLVDVDYEYQIWIQEKPI